MREGTAAIVQEAEALGDPVVLEILRYILNAPAERPRLPERMATRPRPEWFTARGSRGHAAR